MDRCGGCDVEIRDNYDGYCRDCQRAYENYYAEAERTEQKRREALPPLEDSEQ